MAKYLVHKAIEADKCKAGVKKLLAQPGYLEDNYRAFAKYDGCCVVVLVDDDGEVKYLSRTGEDANLHHLDDSVRTLFGEIATYNRGIVLFGEAWWPGRDQFPEISGAFRRHAGDTRLKLVLNDAVTLDEFTRGVSTRPFSERHRGLLSAFKGYESDPHTDSITHAREYQPHEYLTAKALAEALVNRGGYDGLIMRDPKGEWRKGDSGNGGEIIKVKHRVSIDVRCTGLVEGKGKQAGMTGALKFFWKGECEVGTGLTDATRISTWTGHEHHTKDSPVGRIMEVECLGFTPDGKPREPSFKGWRFDKPKADNE